MLATSSFAWFFPLGQRCSDTPASWGWEWAGTEEGSSSSVTSDAGASPGGCPLLQSWISAVPSLRGNPRLTRREEAKMDSGHGETGKGVWKEARQ